MSDPLWGVSSASSAAGAAGTASTAQTDSGSVADRLGSMSKDTFMALLVAQLKYQNPMQPTDSMDFVNQLAMFSMIEQLQAIREDLDSIRGAAGQNANGGGAGDSGSTAPPAGSQ